MAVSMLIVIVVYAVLAAASSVWLYRTATRPWTWQRPLPAPKVVAAISYPEDPTVGLV